MPISPQILWRVRVLSKHRSWLLWVSSTIYDNDKNNPQKTKLGGEKQVLDSWSIHPSPTMEILHVFKHFGIGPNSKTIRENSVCSAETFSKLPPRHPNTNREGCKPKPDKVRSTFRQSMVSDSDVKKKRPSSPSPSVSSRLSLSLSSWRMRRRSVSLSLSEGMSCSDDTEQPVSGFGNSRAQLARQSLRESSLASASHCTSVHSSTYWFPRSRSVGSSSRKSSRSQFPVEYFDPQDFLDPNQGMCHQRQSRLRKSCRTR